MELSTVSILKATRQPSTIFSTVYDLKMLKIYLFYNSQFEVPYVLDVKKELAKTRDYRKVSLADLISNKRMKRK